MRHFESLATFAFAIGLLVAVNFDAASAQSQNCAPRTMVIERLADKYGEARQSIGMGQQGMVMETFANLDSGSWTITATTPNGMTCLIASGQSYEVLAEVLPEPEEDA